jgi:hypothetical protein
MGGPTPPPPPVPGPPGGPPRSRRTGVVLAGVAVLAVLGFGAFVAPGFLVDDDSESNGDDGGPGTTARADETAGSDQPAGSQEPAGSEEPAGSGETADDGAEQQAAPASLDEFGQALADAVDQHAADELEQMLCDDATQYPRDAFAAVEGITSAELAGTDETDPAEPTVTLEVAIGDRSNLYDFVVTPAPDGFCVQDGSPGPADG